MSKTIKEILIKAIEDYNEKQQDNDDRIDFYDAFDSLNDATDEEVQAVVDELAKRTQ